MKLYQIVSSGLKLETLLVNSLNQFRHVLRAPSEKVIAESHVYLREKKIVRHQIFVKKGAIVSVLVPDALFTKLPFQLSEDQIVYEDGDIIVVDKPSGLSTQSTQTPGEDHLYGAVIAYLTAKNPSKLAYVGLHHRLDRDTSGLVLMTKKSSANKSISDQFKERQIQKRYLAVVEGAVPEPKRWKTEAAIGRIYGSKEFRFGIDNKKGDPATTLFEYQKSLDATHHVIECQPITGRTHQIRIHLASHKLPIVGDRLYGVKSDKRMQLFAYRLQFKHPITQKKMDLSSSQIMDF
jgi:23S rRNA pseudouridine1911/1915/1917 synthase